MKKICHITSVHPRYELRILKKQCVTLAQNGYDVTLIVNDNKGDEVFEGVKIIATGFSPKNRLDRFLNSRKYILKKARSIKADVFQLHDPDLLLIVKRLKKTGAKVIFDSHENYPDQISCKPYLPKFISKIIAKIFIVIEKSTFKKCDGLITVNERIKGRLERINNNTVIITNYPFKYNDNIDFNNKQRKVCFAGGVNKTYNHENIIKAIEGIEDITYELAGQATKEYINELKRLGGYNKTNFYGRISFDEVQRIYHSSLVGLVIHYSKLYQPLQFGGIGVIKLFEFMEAGLAIVCSNYSIWKEIIEENKCGIAVDPGNVNEIRDAVQYLLDNRDAAINMGKNARKAFLEKYNWDSQAETLLDFYRKLVK